MRLLKVNQNGEFTTLTEDMILNIPSYAILSHTWGDDQDEVNFKDMTVGPRKSKTGYQKLRFCAKQAVRDKLEFIWIDSCCIDRSNSTELSEAINSMFHWYQRATRCYVYLPDVETDCDNPIDCTELWETQFRNSRWFTRGWTLQELLAPLSVEFFCSRGIKLGDKKSLERQLHSITGIPVQALRGSPLSKFPVSERFSWAETRQTKREEDKAYSLLGIFDVHIPLIYGEGMNKALKRLKEDIDKNSRPEQDTILLNSLSYAVDAPFNSHQRQHEPICLPDTRVDILKEIDEWSCNISQRSIFWLSGFAGTGKSTIARTVATNFHEQRRLGASFFFSRGGGDVSHADKFVTSIAVQLARSIPDLQQHVCDAIKEHGDITNRSFNDQWKELVLRPLSKMKRDASSTAYVLVVDALDECSNKRDVQSLLHLLSQEQTTDVRLRVFLTSRPELSIRYAFAQIRLEGYQRFVLHNIQPSTVNHDIQHFLENKLAIIRQEQFLELGWPGEKIIQCLIETAGGLFIWAATACRFIHEGKRFAPKRLDLILRGSQHATTAPEKQLDEIYSTVLRQTISDEYTDEEKQESYLLLRYILGSMVTLLSPLCISSFSRLIQVPIEDLERVLDELHSILDIPRERHKSLRLHHPSFRDFLFSKERCTDTNFQVNEQSMHRRIVLQCMNIMSMSLKQDICSVHDFGTSVRSVTLAHVQRSIPLELQYACLFWIQHLEKSQENLTDQSEIHNFLQKYFLQWLEALLWMRKASEAIYAIDTLRTIIPVGGCPRLSAFVHDARRFFRYGRSAFEKAPLQLYCSALLFAPEKSIVRQTFQNQVPAWMDRLPIVRSDWNALHQTLEPHHIAFRAIAFSSDSKLLVAALEDSSIVLWDTATGDERASFRLDDDFPTDVAFSPDGELLALGTDSGTVRLWDAVTGFEQYCLRGHKKWVDIVTFSANGQLLASGSHDMTVKLWNVTQGSELFTLAGHEGPVIALKFLPDDQLLASASQYGSDIRVWDVKTGTEDQSRKASCQLGDITTISSDGKLFATASNTTITVSKWDAEDEPSIFEDHKPVSSMAISPGGAVLVSGSLETVTMWHIPSQHEQQVFKGHKGWLSQVVFSPDSKLLASTSNDKTIKLWDATTTFKEKPAEDDHKSWINAIEFSPGAQILASASHDNTIKLWDAVRGVGKRIIGSHDAWVNDMAFSPDGKLLATAGDKSVKLWNMDTLEEQKALEGHEEWVNTIEFSPDGKLLASMSIDMTIKLWDIATGSLKQTVKGGTLRLQSPLSHSLITGDSTYVTFVNESHVDLMFFWIDGEGISKHYWTLGPREKMRQPTYVGHFWRIVDANTNQAVGGYCGVPEHIDVIITEEDVKAVEGCRQFLRDTIARLEFWTLPDGPEETPPPRLTVVDNWVVDDSEKQLIWLPHEYRPTFSKTNGNVMVLGHASGQLTFLFVKSAAVF